MKWSSAFSGTFNKSLPDHRLLFLLTNDGPPVSHALTVVVLVFKYFFNSISRYLRPIASIWMPGFSSRHVNDATHTPLPFKDCSV